LADLEQGGNDYNALQQSLENISTEWKLEDFSQ
jgi:hypothetical protein